MPWIKDRDKHFEEQLRFLEPSRVQLMLCGQEIAIRAAVRDRKIEFWLETAYRVIAG